MNHIMSNIIEKLYSSSAGFPMKIDFFLCKTYFFVSVNVGSKNNVNIIR